MKRVYFILIFLMLLIQGTSSQKKESITLNGYLTTMQSVMFDSITGSVLNDNLIHNRLNLKGFAGEHLSFALEIRNRLFIGDMVKSSPDYPELIGMDQGWTDLSWNLMEEESFVINTTVDRYWLDLNYGKFQLRIGRQRINWGQTFVWNPNDIFNAYSFFDFDYVERPGSDAVRLQYFPGFSSAIEMAVKIDSEEDITAAGLYMFNKWGYDIQFLAGYVNNEDFVAGTGWSGSFGSISFRGEASWFQPLKNSPDSSKHGLFTLGFDKLFENNSMAQLQLMYCNNPLKMDNFNSFYSGNMSSKELAFSEISVFGQFSYSANPLLNLSLSAMWFPDLKGYFAGPSVDYSLAENVDFSLIWQHFNSRMGDNRVKINLGFFRIKYSF